MRCFARLFFFYMGHTNVLRVCILCFCFKEIGGVMVGNQGTWREELFVHDSAFWIMI
jgi:hypothetical protein